jgi:hypothetical protein
MKTSNDTIGNRTRYLPAWSAVQVYNTFYIFMVYFKIQALFFALDLSNYSLRIFFNFLMMGFPKAETCREQ